MEPAPALGSFFPKNGSGAALSVLFGAGSLPLPLIDPFSTIYVFWEPAPCSWNKTLENPSPWSLFSLIEKKPMQHYDQFKLFKIEIESPTVKNHSPKVQLLSKFPMPCEWLLNFCQSLSIIFDKNMQHPSIP